MVPMKTQTYNHFPSTRHSRRSRNSRAIVPSPGITIFSIGAACAVVVVAAWSEENKPILLTIGSSTASSKSGERIDSFEVSTLDSFEVLEELDQLLQLFGGLPSLGRSLPAGRLPPTSPLTRAPDLYSLFRTESTTVSYL